MSLLYILDAFGIPWQIVLYLLCHTVQKHAKQHWVRIEESIVVLDVLDLFKVAQFLKKLNHGGLIHDDEELFDQLDFVLHKVRLQYQLLNQKRSDFDLVQLEHQIILVVQLKGDGEFKRMD